MLFAVLALLLSWAALTKSMAATVADFVINLQLYHVKTQARPNSQRSSRAITFPPVAHCRTLPADQGEWKIDAAEGPERRRLAMAPAVGDHKGPERSLLQPCRLDLKDSLSRKSIAIQIRSLSIRHCYPFVRRGALAFSPILYPEPSSNVPYKSPVHPK